jgi:hypothetical protein
MESANTPGQNHPQSMAAPKSPERAKGLSEPQLSQSPEPGIARLEETQRALAANGGRGGLRAFRWGWIAFMVLATSVPYLLNFFSTPAGYHYTWIVPPYPEDSLAYLSWSQQAAHGSLLFQLKYTALPHHAFLFHPFFLVCGWLSSLFACDIGIIHWVMKAVGVVFFLVTFFRYTDYLELTGFQSVVASILLGVSSGMGGLWVWIGLADQLQMVPADLWVPEVNTYWSLLWNPLFPYALALTLLVIYWLDRGTLHAQKRDFWFSGLAAGVLALVHPYSQPLLFAFAVIITVQRRRAEILGYLGRYFLASLPFVLYVVLISELNPLVLRHSAAGEIRSPSPVAYLAGFGFPLLLFVAGLAAGRGQLIKRYWHIILWFLLCLVFSYLPFWFQRKFIFGAHIPLCIMAGISFDMLLTRCSGASARIRRQVLVIAAVVLLPLLASTPVYLLASQGREVKNNADGTYFISDDILKGLMFLKNRGKPNEIVFATLATSRLIPAFSGNTVLWGHWAMSVDLNERENWLANLINNPSNQDDDRRGREFWGAGIQYVFADGDLRQALDRNPHKWRFILDEANVVFTNGAVTIYQHQGG